MTPNLIYDRNNINHLFFLRKKKKDQPLFESVVSKKIQILSLMFCI